jgi:hypothetical protein
MIGQMPRWRPAARRRRTLPYTLPRRTRRRMKQAREPLPVDTGLMLFDPSSELPRAEVVRTPATFTELVVEGVVEWFRARLRWMRPRTIPLVVAAIGLALTVEAVHQLSRPPLHESSTASAASYSTYQPGRVRIVLQQ